MKISQASFATFFGWVTRIIFYLIDKRPFVRFHAAQSVVVFGGIAILYVVLRMFVGAHRCLREGFAGAGSFFDRSSCYSIPYWDLVAFVLWILLMVKAYQGQKFRIPIAADVAEKIFGVSLASRRSFPAPNGFAALRTRGHPPPFFARARSRSSPR